MHHAADSQSKDMAITIKYFASLREELKCDGCALDDGGIATVADVRRALGIDSDAFKDALCAVNYEYAKDETAVRDGDEVAFFPPVTGG